MLLEVPLSTFTVWLVMCLVEVPTMFTSIMEEAAIKRKSLLFIVARGMEWVVMERIYTMYIQDTGGNGYFSEAYSNGSFTGTNNIMAYELFYK